MNSKMIDLSGQRFGFLTVIELHKKEKCKAGTKLYWKCKCDCGKETIVRSDGLKSGKVVSCGCYNKMLSSEKAKKMKNKWEQTRVDGAVCATLRRKTQEHSSKYKGVHFDGRQEKRPWIARITINKKTHHIGSFETEKQAYDARKEAEKVLHDPYLEKEKALKGVVCSQGGDAL